MVALIVDTPPADIRYGVQPLLDVQQLSMSQYEEVSLMPTLMSALGWFGGVGGVLGGCENHSVLVAGNGRVAR